MKEVSLKLSPKRNQHHPFIEFFATEVSLIELPKNKSRKHERTLTLSYLLQIK